MLELQEKEIQTFTRPHGVIGPEPAGTFLGIQEGRRTAFGEKIDGYSLGFIALLNRDRIGYHAGNDPATVSYLSNQGVSKKPQESVAPQRRGVGPVSTGPSGGVLE